MRFHYNTTPDETIAYLRDQAIRAKQPPAVIDALDELAGLLDLPADLEKEQEEASALQNAVDDLREELSCLVDQTQLASDILQSIDKNRDRDDLHNIAQQLDYAKKALERHKA